MKHRSAWRFADFLLDAGSALLWHNGEAIKLRPKAFEVLRYLVQNRDRLVTKDELLAAVWPGLVVGDTNLQLCLSEIRKALEDDSRHPRFIETVHRLGYRFHVRAQEADQAANAGPDSGSDVFSGAPATSRRASYPGPIPGRDLELAQLQQHFGAAESGHRQIVFVSGEPGIGKTTLVAAFLQRVEPEDRKPPNRRRLTDTSQASARGTKFPLIARGQCVIQFGQEVAYLPVFEALTALAEDEPGVAGALRRYAPSWAAQMPGLRSGTDPSAAPAPPPRVTTERLLREFAEASEALCRNRTLVLWLDDLHDSDTSTLNLVAYLARRRQRARLLFIGTYRTAEVHRVEHHPLKVIEQGLRERELCTHLSLRSLAESAIDELLALRLPGKLDFPVSALSRLIHARTEGNPLFVVHVLDDIIERRVLSLRDSKWELDPDHANHLARVPSRLEDMLGGQIRMLAAEEREVLEAASVSGMRFPVQTLSAATGRDPLAVEQICERLAGQDHFIRRDGAELWPDGSRAIHYQFRHALHQEVAYAQIPALRLEALHQEVGESKERSHAADIGAVAVELASHFERSRDYVRAVHYLQAGFQQASRRSAFKEGLKLATKGLSLIPRLSDPLQRTRSELGLRMALGVSYAASVGAASQEAGTQCQRVLELSKQAEDNIELFPVLSGLFGFYLVKSGYPTAHEVGCRLLAIAQREQSHVLTLAAHVALGMVCWHMGELVAAREHFEQRAAHYRPEDHLTFLQFSHDPAVTSLSFAAPVYWYLGYPDTARRAAEEGIALAKHLSHAYTLGVALLFGARPFQECQQLSRIEALVREHDDICRDQDFTEADARRQLSRGWLLARQGRLEEAIESLRAGLATCEKLGTRMETSYHLSVLAQAQASNRQYDESLRNLDEALRFSHESAEGYFRAEIHRLRAEVLLAQFDHRQTPDHAAETSPARATEAETLTRAEDDIRQALVISRQQRARSLELRAAMSLVELRARETSTVNDRSRQSGLEAAMDTLRDVYSCFTEGFDTPDLIRARTMLDLR